MTQNNTFNVLKYFHGPNMKREHTVIEALVESHFVEKIQRKQTLP